MQKVRLNWKLEVLGLKIEILQWSSSYELGKALSSFPWEFNWPHHTFSGLCHSKEL